MAVCSASAAVVCETLELPARTEHIEAMHACVARFWAAAEQQLAQPLPVHWRQEFETAVMEIVNNIIRHAYAPSPTATIHIELTCSSCCVKAHFRDRGAPFTKSLPTSAHEMPDPLTLPEGGWGLHIVHEIVDELSYTRDADGVNHWRLRKNIQP